MNIAVIGAGISGLVAAYRLQEQHLVTVFDVNAYAGGHTNTIMVPDDDCELAVDTGFIVFNEETYPQFIQLLNELGVASHRTTMSFSMKCDRTGLEYRGADFDGLFAQRKNLVNPRFWRLLYDIVQFKKVATPLLVTPSGKSVGAFLNHHNFSPQFVDQYFLPMGAAIWSSPVGTFLDFPIDFIVEFYSNHGLLGVSERPDWRVVTGGSHQYVKRLTSKFAGRLHLKTAVTAVSRFADHVELRFRTQEPAKFDHVIFACHSDQALKILGEDALPIEHKLLSAFPYQKNTATLHTQTSVLPKSRRAWAAWNYHREFDEGHLATLTYNMNILQSLRSKRTFCVTLNDNGRIQDENIIEQIEYAHPLFNLQRKSMQARHDELIDTKRTSFCGAYWGDGFHEAGVQSGLRVANRLLSHGCAGMGNA